MKFNYPKRKNVWSLLDILFITSIFYGVIALVYLFRYIYPHELSQFGVIFILIASSVIAIPALVFLIKEKKIDFLNYFNFDISYNKIATIIILTPPISFIAFIFQKFATDLFNLSSGETFSTTQSFLTSGNIYVNALTLFFLSVIVAPIIEEIVYRGIIFNYLKDYFSVPLSVILTSLFFGINHLSIEGFVFIFVISIFLTYSYHKTKSIAVPIVLHASLNFFVVTTYVMTTFNFNI